MKQMTQDEWHLKLGAGKWMDWSGRSAKSPMFGHIFVEANLIPPGKIMPRTERGYAADFDWKNILAYRVPTSKEEHTRK